MSKLTYEQSKAELAKLEGAIKSLSAAGIEIPPVLQKQFDVISKQLNGNASAQVAELLNSSIAPAFEKPNNAAMKEALAKAIGTRARVTLVVGEDGKITFEAAGSTSTGSGNTGITRNDSAFNHWAVKNKKTGDEAAFTSANEALLHILGTTKEKLAAGDITATNPMNLGGNFGKGNSAVRVLTSILPKNPVFVDNFEVTGSKVEVAPKESTINTGTQEQATV